LPRRLVTPLFPLLRLRVRLRGVRDLPRRCSRRLLNGVGSRIIVKVAVSE